MHLTFTVSDIANTLDLIDEFVFRGPYPDTNSVKVLLVNMTWADSFKDGLAYRTINSSILKISDLENRLALGV